MLTLLVATVAAAWLPAVKPALPGFEPAIRTLPAEPPTFNETVPLVVAKVRPLAVVPASLFIGFLEAGSLSMQRQIGVPSALIAVIEGLTMLFALAATVRRA